MEHKHTIPVEVNALGFEEAAEKIELMADAIDSLPATVNIKAKDCEINVHTTNIVEKQEPFKTYAPGGVIRPKPDYEPEANAIDKLILKLTPLERDQELIMLARIKNRCKNRNECEGCWYHRSEDELNINACMLSGGIPGEWMMQPGGGGIPELEPVSRSSWTE